MRVIDIPKLETFSEFAERWDGVVSQALTPNLFLTSDWLQTWWTHFGKDRELSFLLIEGEGGEPVGVAPLMITRQRAGGVSLRVLEFPGADAPTCADHLEIAAKSGSEEKVAAAVGDYLMNHRRRWDSARFAGAAQDSTTMRRLGEQLRVNRYATQRRPAIPCPYLPLDQTAAEYDKHLRRKFRDLRKYLGAIEQRQGRFLLVRTAMELRRILVELRRLCTLRVMSKGGIPSLARDDFFAFLTDVCSRFLQHGWLRLYALEVEDEIIAVNLNFAYGGKVYGYLSGFDPKWTRQGIGTVLMRHVIFSSMEEGFGEYDFLRGDEEYKYRWTSRQRSQATVEVVNHSLRYWGFTVGRLAERVQAKVWRRLISGKRVGDRGVT